MKYLSAILILLLFLIPLRLEAQQRGTTYESLLQRSDQPSSYITHIVLPNPHGDATVGVMFRLDYDLIPFLRVRSSITGVPEGAEYFAPVQMGLEIFEGTHRSSRRGSSPQGRSTYRDSYQDTIYVNSFEETRSRLQHVQGLLSTKLEPGEYNYELQLRRAQSTREQSSTRRNIKIPEYDTLSNASMILLQDFQNNEGNKSGTFLNYGENVLYGSDYKLLVILPENGEEFHLMIHKMRSGTSTEAESDQTFTDTIRADSIFRAEGFSFNQSSSDIGFTMNESGEGIRFGVISVPNSEFENARFRLQIKNSEEEVITEHIVNSRWLDMPVSLLNIDVAMNMLRYIVDDSELRRLQSGSSAEKERKFREFWEERDPTPDTEFNELMAEYYNRIDYAFRNYSSLQTPGYESDRGRAYILYGEPDNIERRLPTDQPTREIWEYPGRTLVFEATSGFGDFRLISER